MNMTHKEALYAVWCEHDQRTVEKLDASIRAYIEARGLVLVPEGEWVSHESALAAINYLNRTKDPHRAIKSARMLAYAPDPFKEDAA